MIPWTVEAIHKVNASRGASQRMATAARSNGLGITPNMEHGVRDGKKEKVASALLRLSLEHGGSPESWANRMYGAESCYQRVAQMNAALRRIGLCDRVAELMGPIERSLAAAPQADCQHREAVADLAEDLEQEAYRVNPCEQTARALLRKRAAERAASLDDDQRIAAQWGLTL